MRWGGALPRAGVAEHVPASLPASPVATRCLGRKFTHDRLGTAFRQTTHRALGEAQHTRPQTLCIPGAGATGCPGAADGGAR
jgi:hypothetical protein